MATDKIIEVSQGGMLAHYDPDLPQRRSPLRWFVFYELYKRSAWVRTAVDRIVTRAIRDKYKLEDVDNPDNPQLVELEAFLDTANDRESFIELLVNILTDLLIYGRSYLFMEPTAGRAAGTVEGIEGVAALHALDARITYPITDGHGTVVRHEQFYNGEVVNLELDEVLYFSLGNAGSEAMGLSKLETLVDALAVEMEAENFNARFFANNLSVGVWVDLPDGDEKTAQEQQKRLEGKFTSSKNAHKPLVTYGGAKLLKDSASVVKDIAFKVLFDLTRDKVAAVYGVPVFLMVGDGGGATKSSGGILDKGFWEGTVRPLLSLVFTQFTRQFIHDTLGFDTVQMRESSINILPSEVEIDSTLKIAQLGLTFNEIRELQGKPPLANGDFPVMWTGGGYIRLDRTVLPGLGNPDITPEEAEQELLEAQVALDEEGMPVEDEGEPIEDDAIEDEGTGEEGDASGDAGSRVIDLTLSAQARRFALLRAQLAARNSEIEHVVRRVPVNPGSRGGKGYFDANGKWHYGLPGEPDEGRKKRTANSKARKAAASAAKKAANEKKRAAKKAQSEREKAAKKAASERKKAQRESERARKAHEREAKKQSKEKERAETKARKAAEKEAARQRKQQISQATAELEAFKVIMDAEGLTEAQVNERLIAMGWDAEGDYSNPQEALDAASSLAGKHEDMVFVVMEIAGRYVVNSKPLNKFSGEADADNAGFVKSAPVVGEDAVKRALGTHGTEGELTHPYMTSRITATQEAVDSATFGIWLAKVKNFVQKG
jgi:HK97 family phage portal protein